MTARHVARNAFLSAIDDADLELKVLEIKPKELEAALEINQRFEAVQLKVSIASGSQHIINRYSNQKVNNDRVKKMISSRPGVISTRKIVRTSKTTIQIRLYEGVVQSTRNNQVRQEGASKKADEIREEYEAIVKKLTA